MASTKKNIPRGLHIGRLKCGPGDSTSQDPGTKGCNAVGYHAGDHHIGYKGEP